VRRFEYKIAGQRKEETIWVCDICKKAYVEKILQGKWKMIGMIDNKNITCGVCDNDKKKSERA